MAELQAYRVCLDQQLEELDLLNSIYCGAGELKLLEAGVVADFNEFLQGDVANSSIALLRSNLEYIIALTLISGQKLDVRIELPHLYPRLQLPIVSVHTPLLSKDNEQHLQTELKQYLAKQQLEEPDEQQQPYIYQLLSWLQEQIEVYIQQPAKDLVKAYKQPAAEGAQLNFERLWIYSHHIKCSSKRQELIKQARLLQLSGFSRPGKPGIVCVEGEQQQVQQFWRIIKALHWQKICMVKSELKQHLNSAQLQQQRRFNGFSEQLFNAESASGEEGVMNMSQFMHFLEAHNSAYMKAELFGIAS